MSGQILLREGGVTFSYTEPFIILGPSPQTVKLAAALVAYKRRYAY